MMQEHADLSEESSVMGDDHNIIKIYVRPTERMQSEGIMATSSRGATGAERGREELPRNTRLHLGTTSKF